MVIHGTTPLKHDHRPEDAMIKSLSLSLFAAAFVTTGMVSHPERPAPEWQIPAALVAPGTPIEAGGRQDAEPITVARRYM